MISPDDIRALRISLASPEEILSWSFGEVTKPETINFRSLKPERDGLFCARIFGPVNDWECLCGKYKRQKFKGVTCDKCGVEVTKKDVRRDRMGHIKLASPVSHIWYFKGVPSRIGYLLDISLKDLENVLYFEAYAVTDKGITPLKDGEVISEERFHEVRAEYGKESFKAQMGAEGIRELLKRVDIESMAVELRHAMKAETSTQKRIKVAKRLKIVEAFKRSANKPEWMTLEVVPVLPPELRPLVPLDGGRFATSDLNDLYRRVINRNNRLKKLIELNAPDVIRRNEKRMLQEAVDALFENGKRGRLLRGVSGRTLKSLSDSLKGKQGRFRQNLLGKRVDYSGRSVVVVGPDLKLDQCGLPKKMALELFKPFIFNQLELKGHAATIRQAKEMVEQGGPEVLDVLEEVIQNHPVMLNRAPTLHRLGVQAFQPVLVEGKAIRLHPLVCTAFNADFDGDQMAVHVPLSPMAQIEAKVLMTPGQNLLSHQSGEPAITPTREILAGCYYLTTPRNGLNGEGLTFGSMDSVIAARNAGAVETHTIIQLRLNKVVIGGNGLSRSVSTPSQDFVNHEQTEWSPPGRLIVTTVGRVIFNLGLPPELPFFNFTLDKKSVHQLIADTYSIGWDFECPTPFTGSKVGERSRTVGLTVARQHITIKLLDALKEIGFEWATRSGLSFGSDDFRSPGSRRDLIQSTLRLIDGMREDSSGIDLDGTLRSCSSLRAWFEAQTKIEQDIRSMHFSGHSGAFIDPIDVALSSGSGVGLEKLRELSGLVGILADADGGLRRNPVLGNFYEGLCPAEYFATAAPARQRLIEQSIRIAEAGYLTRKLMNAAQNLVIQEFDCGAVEGLEVLNLPGGDGTGEIPLERRLLGRVLAKDLVSPITLEKIALAGTIFDRSLVRRLEYAGVTRVSIRSPLMCRAAKGVCATCYGHDPATGQLAQVGDAVGVLAAHAISEFATQSQMDAKHFRANIQAVIQSGKGQSAHRSGRVRYLDMTFVEHPESRQRWSNSAGGRMVLIGDGDEPLQSWLVPSGAELLVSDGCWVKEGTWLFRMDPDRDVIRASVEGEASIEPLPEISHTGISQAFIIRNDVGRVQARIPLEVGFTPIILGGQYVFPGLVIAIRPRMLSKARTPVHRIAELTRILECRPVEDPALLASISGTVYIGRNRKKPGYIEIIGDEDESEDVKIPPRLPLRVRDRERVTPGTRLTGGTCDLQALYRLAGKQETYDQAYALIRKALADDGEKVCDIHFEVLLSRMFSWVMVANGGSTGLVEGEILAARQFEVLNQKAIREGEIPASANPHLMGITKISLHTDSVLAAAAFQETTKVLTQASLEGRIDYLQGFSENVAIGRLIPAGTGMPTYQNLEIEEGMYPDLTDCGLLGPDDFEDEYNKMATHAEELQGLTEVEMEDI